MLRLQLDREMDGGWIAQVYPLDVVMVHGESREEASRLALALALRVLADRIDHRGVAPGIVGVHAQA